MEVLLCRHGQTDQNKKGIVQGHMDSSINRKGRKQAEKLRNRLAKQNISKTYSSSMTRALETAEIVAEPHGSEIEKTDKLIEQPREEYRGEKIEKLIEDVTKSETEDYLWKTDSGENLKQVQERSVKFLDSIKQKHENEKVLIISHSATIKCLLLGIIGHSAKNSYRIEQENCSINKLVWDSENGWSIQSVNNTSHLT